MERTSEKKLTEPEPVWQRRNWEPSAFGWPAHQTGLLATLGTTIQGIASMVFPSGLPLNLAVVERLMLTLLFSACCRSGSHLGSAHLHRNPASAGNWPRLRLQLCLCRAVSLCLAHAQADKGLTDRWHGGRGPYGTMSTPRKSRRSTGRFSTSMDIEPRCLQ